MTTTTYYPTQIYKGFQLYRTSSNRRPFAAEMPSGKIDCMSVTMCKRIVDRHLRFLDLATTLCRLSGDQ